jgi:signal transduction histidine kinase
MPVEPLSILIVEDDADARTTLCNLIAMEFPELAIRFAVDGHSGLQCYQQQPADMVVTDLSMPVMDGISMAAGIKALNDEVVLIALTSYSDASFLLRSIEIGIDHYLLKPLVCEKLYAVLHKTIASKTESSRRKTMAAALHKYQADLEIANEQLEQRVNERTAELEALVRDQESFSYSVSHDLRAPLRHINGFSAILVEEYAHYLPIEARQYLDRITSASSRMGALIDHLLELSRVGRTEIKPGPVNLSELAHATLTMLRETESSRILEVRIEENLSVFGDPALLRQLLQNLLGNAWKYTSAKPLTRIEFGFLAEASVFFIKDNGAGFDMAYKHNLFRAFERLHGAEFEGNGIGLSTAQRIINRHGGEIWAEASVGQGATFYFTLPTCQAAHPFEDADLSVPIPPAAFPA